MAKTKHKLKRLFITEVSGVLAGANPFADMLIAKTKGDFPDGFIAQAKSFAELDKEALKALGQETLSLLIKGNAQTFDDALEAQARDEQVGRLLDGFYDKVWALRRSLRSIFEDGDLTDPQRGEMIQSSLEEFQRAISGDVEEIVSVLQDDEDEEDENTSTEDTPSQAKGAPVAKSKTPTIAELQATNDTLVVDLQKALTLAELTDVQKAHLSTLDEAGQEAFLALSGDERLTQANKALADDETLQVGEQVIRKSVVGNEAFEAFKAQQARIDGEVEKRELVEYREKAESLYPWVPGTPTEKGETLRVVATLDTSPREAIEALFAGFNQALKDLGRPKGHSDESEPAQESGVMKTLKNKYGKKDE